MKRRGFTLVEIMIVVGIIGLLATIAVPTWARARTTSQKKACINNLRQIDGAVQQWSLENKQAADAAPSDAEVLSYLKSAVVCPAGGTTFANSYDVTTVAARPTCISAGGTAANGHELPADMSN